jgi:hypothetical protein
MSQDEADTLTPTREDLMSRTTQKPDQQGTALARDPPSTGDEGKDGTERSQQTVHSAESDAPLGLRVEQTWLSSGGVRVAATFDPPPSSQDEDEPGEREYYVYAHRDAAGRMFYVGKGKEQRAWSTDRHDLWHKYVKERLGGQYTVEILQKNLTEAEAEWAEARLLSEHGAALVNWDNPSRGDDYAALAQYHARRDANALLVARAKVLEGSVRAEAIKMYSQALEELRGYESLVLMRGSLVAELLSELPKMASPEILDRLTLCLVRERRVEEARAVAAAFMRVRLAASKQLT